MALIRRASLIWTTSQGASQFLNFDLVTSEDTERTVSITTSPVEKGPNVADNARAELPGISLEVFVSNAPIRDANYRGSSNQLVELPPPTYPAKVGIFAVINTFIGGYDQPIPTSVSALKFNQLFDAVKETENVLNRLEETAQLIDVYTTTSAWRGCVLESHHLHKDSTTGTGGTFTLAFKQIKIVELKVVTAPVPTEVRAKTAVKKGPQGPVVVDPAQRASFWDKLAHKSGALP